MSVDLEATLPRPLTLAAVLTAARDTLTDLLGLDAVPGLHVVADRRYERGRRLCEGRRLTGPELLSTVIGGPVEQADEEPPNSVHYEVDVDGGNDTVLVMVIDHLPEAGGGTEAVFSPPRTCVGVVTAVALALAVADLAGGRFVDDQIGMLRPRSPDPAHVVASTRLPPGNDDFVRACERYLRQFAHLNGWPASPSMP
ncbi:hypothetical protein GA0070606_0819 [Micromonospora citrea]|uniref:Uncharacterized protein n=1 Tax=Micromonospora citrea TaxID=47855 RepID=A0A1C6TV72_9ACTN|nr:hypothetical protein [Micromonospora citrea]SCL45647.1 hypothetical protein GA0070606_0819 [Micromonospora citrea]